MVERQVQVEDLVQEQPVKDIAEEEELDNITPVEEAAQAVLVEKAHIVMLHVEDKDFVVIYLDTHFIGEAEVEVLDIAYTEVRVELAEAEVVQLGQQTMLEVLDIITAEMVWQVVLDAGHKFVEAMVEHILAEEVEEAVTIIQQIKVETVAKES
jgi:hypothetical protein